MVKKKLKIFKISFMTLEEAKKIYDFIEEYDKIEKILTDMDNDYKCHVIVKTFTGSTFTCPDSLKKQVLDLLSERLKNIEKALSITV